MKSRKKNYLKIGDRVKIITGDDKGLIGNILSINKKENKAIIEGVVPRIKYVKNQSNEASTKVEKPKNIDLSNMMLWDKTLNKVSRIGYKIVNNEKIRYFKKSGTTV
jgi:large subunit ribosomal protein L24